MVNFLAAGFLEFIQNPIVLAVFCIVCGMIIIGGYILLKKFQDKKYREEHGMPIEKRGKHNKRRG